MRRLVVPRLIPAMLLTAVGLVLAHGLVFLLRYGSVYGEALAHAGHGPAWTAASVGVAAAGGLLLGIAGVRLWQLRRRIGPASPVVGEPGRRSLLRAWLVAAGWLTPIVFALLSIQENVEHLAAGLGLPGPAILLTAEYPWATAVVALVGLLVAGVTTLLAWRRAVLVARLRAERARPQRAGDAAPPPEPSVGRPASSLGRRLGRRAPPVLAAN
ncbi:MAG TPA: hypothetical protein VNH13_02690 [Candidatus Acidoferrales bacterium]|nr:hypothetical protein [Candidatus Acidoferrales bacterium]